MQTPATDAQPSAAHDPNLPPLTITLSWGQFCAVLTAFDLLPVFIGRECPADADADTKALHDAVDSTRELLRKAREAHIAAHPDNNLIEG